MINLELAIVINEKNKNQPKALLCTAMLPASLFLIAKKS